MVKKGKQMNKLIGLIGYKGSGKTTLTRAAINCWNGVNAVQMGMSNPIERAMKAIGIPVDIYDDKSQWDKPLNILCGKTLRNVTQTFGTEWGRRMVGEEFWINLAIETAKKHLLIEQKSVILDGIRFPNEFDAIHNNGGMLIAFERDGFQNNDDHESERNIAQLQAATRLKFRNVGTFEESAENWKKLLHKLIDS